MGFLPMHRLVSPPVMLSYVQYAFQDFGSGEQPSVDLLEGIGHDGTGEEGIIHIFSLMFHQKSF